MIKAIRGTKDILPEESAKCLEIERVSRSVFERFGYREIRTPAMEETSLFVKTVGEDTDIVTKEMFSFTDRGGRKISLRPEGTAPIVRAYLENNLDKTAPFQKLYYIGPMFRAERPQAGRLRQFNQIGVEAIGSANPAIDAEVIQLVTEILDRSGLKGYELRLNNLGCREDKKNLSKILKKELSVRPVAARLCADCRRRLKTNPLRVLDCKNPGCRSSIADRCREVKFLCDGCRGHFDEVARLLNSLNIPYAFDPHIVRGLDYYTRTVFEVIHHSLGSQNAIGAGGRYDDLISDMGGPKIGACGFALGVERMMLALGDGSPAGSSGVADLFIAAIGKDAFDKMFPVLGDLRRKGVRCEIDYEGRSLKSQMRAADKLRARFVLIVGDNELAKGEAVLRDMSTGEQTGVRFPDIAGTLAGKINPSAHPRPLGRGICSG